MNDNPRTARDALIIELLGDLGAVHDEIKKIPVNLKGSLRESLEHIANSVEEAEQTARNLQQVTEAALKSVSDLQVEKLGNETRQTIEKCFSRAINDEIKKTEKIAINLQETLQRFPDFFGNQYKKLSYLFFTLTVLVVLLSATGMTVLYFQAKNWEERSVGIFNAYQEQQKIILSLPDNERAKFRK